MDSSEFLLGVAGVSATLIGTFIVGVFFYLDTDLHRITMATDAADRYLRSGVRWVFAVYALPLFVALTLAVFEPIWGALTFIALGVIVVLCTVDTGRRMLMRGASGESIGLAVNQWLCTAAVVVLVALPWVIGGWVPSATAFIPSILLALAAAFASTVALVMRQFDLTAAMADSGSTDHDPDCVLRGRHSKCSPTAADAGLGF
ncbi:hypothetical protein [Herbiconiux liukaitaii]|uniref:hypothetical protein n=1 Tax=Herbiconiux liukaitaii TaxID=3342799 RepID=UPI0035B9912C